MLHVSCSTFVLLLKYPEFSLILLTFRVFFPIPEWPRFGYGSVTVRGWNGSSGSGSRFRWFLSKKGFSLFQYSLTGKDGSGSGFGSWKTVPAVPVPLSVSGKTLKGTPTPKISALLRKRPVFTKGQGAKTALLRTFFVVKCAGRGLVVKRPGVLNKVLMLNLVLGVGVFSLLPNTILTVPVPASGSVPGPPCHPLCGYPLWTLPNLFLWGMAICHLISGKKKQHKHKLFWSGFLADIPDPYARTPLGQKVSPHHRGRRKTHFLVRTSTIFGADVHDPKGSRKTLYKKSLR